MSFDQQIREEARLIILKALVAEIGHRLNSNLLVASLDSFGITRNRDWVHSELRWLENVGAVELKEANSVLIADLTQRGMDHVLRTAVIDGVKRPSLRS